MNRYFSFARIWAVMMKEFVQMKRDRLTFAMMVGIPIIQLILFGYAINADPRKLPTAVVAAEAPTFSRSLLAPTTRRDIVVRMLLNLKRIYVHMRSFPQARVVTELLVTLTPSALSELRDRGLLAYHLNDVTGALRDLQTYLKLSSMTELDSEAREEHEQIWEHVKTLRRRVAALN